MKDNELEFLQQQLEATELLPCATCRQETLHAHLEVIARYPQATEFVMACTTCATRRTWMHVETSA